MESHKIIALAFLIAAPLLVAADKPNVLLISIDDLNNWVEYLGGHPQVKTPAMNRLAERGIAFTDAHCSSPLCMPSRTAILTGLSETRTGVYTNGDKFKYKEYKLLPQYFADHGYVTYGAGKIHHKKINDKMFQHALTTGQRWSPFDSKDVSYTKQELPSKDTDNPRHVIANGPGGKSYVLPFNRMSSERYPKDPKGESFDWASFDLPDQAFGDGVITTWALEKLKEHKEDKPFFMAVGYYRPHIPLYAPKKYFDLYPLESIRLPKVLEDDLSDIPEPGKERALSAVTAGTHQHVVKHKQWKNAVQAYLACVSFIDSQIGKLLDYLDKSPYAKNTIVVLYSDHGWHLGEKRAWGKLTGWFHSTNTPFIICPPGSQMKSRCREPVSLLDVYPTLIDMAGLPKRELDGVSLAPLLKNPALKTKRVIKTHFKKGNYALSSNEWRLIHYREGGEELYNIKKDPLEFENLIGKPEHRSVIEELKKNVR
jgi:arylsulfatase A-like enzyme